MATGEQVIRAPAQLGVALKAGGTSQARLSQLELQPGASEQPQCPAGADGR
jgi:hypothetical protein